MEIFNRKIDRMTQDFGKAIFEATFASFSQHIFEKQLCANKIEIELLRTYEGKAKSVSSHVQIIKHVRRNVDILNSLLKEIQDYFYDLRIGSVYTLFQTIFRMLVYTLKVLSQCYLKRFQSEQTHPIQNAATKEVVKYSAQSQQNQRINLALIYRHKRTEDAKKIERLDLELAHIESKEVQLQIQMSKLITNLQAEKEKVMKVSAGVKHQMLDEIQKVLTDISVKSEYFFGSYFKSEKQHQSQMVNCMKPEQFQQEVNSEKRSNNKQKAKRRFQDILSIILNAFKQKLRVKIAEKQFQYQKLVKKLKKQREDFYRAHRERKAAKFNKSQGKSLEDIKKQVFEQIVKIADDKVDHRDLYIEELEKSLETTKKQYKFSQIEIEQLKQALKKEKTELIKTQFQKQELEKLLKKKAVELQDSKKELVWTMQKKAREQAAAIAIASRKSSEAQKQLSVVKAILIDEEAQTDFLFQQNKPYRQNYSRNKRYNSGGLSFPDKERNDKKAKDFQQILKKTLEQMNQLLFDQNMSQTEQNQFNKLIKQQKYQEAIQKIKQKLESRSNQTNDFLNSYSTKNLASHKGKTSKKILKKNATKRNSKEKQKILAQIGVQTDKQPPKKFQAKMQNNSSKLRDKRLYRSNNSSGIFQSGKEFEMKEIKQNYCREQSISTVKGARNINNLRQQPRYSSINNSIYFEKQNHGEAKKTIKTRIKFDNLTFEQLNIGNRQSGTQKRNRITVVDKMVSNSSKMQIGQQSLVKPRHARYESNLEVAPRISEERKSENPSRFQSQDLDLYAVDIGGEPEMSNLISFLNKTTQHVGMQKLQEALAKIKNSPAIS